MRKIILAINVTPDGFCDHRAVIADDELHRFHSNLLKNGDTILFGRKTFQLMEAYWPSVAKNNTGTREEIEFALLIDEIHKIVFSKTGIKTEWKNTTISNDLNLTELLKMKQEPGKDIFVGGPSIVDQLTQHGLIDDYYFLLQPIISGNGKRFFETIKLNRPINLNLHETKFLKSGTVALCYRSATLDSKQAE